MAEALAGAERLVVMGVGNAGRGDDAAGLHAAERLAGRLGGEGPGVLVLKCHDVPENFTGKVRAFRPTHVLIVDAAAAGFPPGTIHVVDPSQIADEDVSTHRTPLSALSRFLEDTASCRVIILGIEPESLEPGAKLTPRVKSAAGRAAAYLARLIANRHGK